MEKIRTLIILSIHYLIFFLVLVSCYAQNKNSTEENDPNQLTHSAEDGEQSRDQPARYTFKDPLFFIEGQLCQHVRKIFQDSKGNLWFGTNIYGIMRYNGDSLEYVSKKEGLGNGRITGIIEDKDGNVWFGTYGGLLKYDGKTFTNFSVDAGLDDQEVWSLTLDKKGIFWVGTMKGVNQFDGKVFTPFALPPANIENPASVLSPSRIICIAEDSQGTIWIGTDGLGLYRYHNGSFSHMTKKDGLPDNVVREIMEDSKGNIWICTMFGGVSCYDGKVFSNFTEEGMVSGIEVGGLFEDKVGDIWFAAENHGVYRYDGKTFTNFYTEEGLNTNGILSILQDRQGRFWLGGWGGLFRYEPLGIQGETGRYFVSVTQEGPWVEELK